MALFMIYAMVSKQPNVLHVLHTGMSTKEKNAKLQSLLIKMDMSLPLAGRNRRLLELLFTQVRNDK